MVEQQPNLFALTGSGVHLTYSSTSISGKPQLTYQDTGQTRQFSGDEIRRLDDADLGTLVSVSLVKTVDAGSTSLTVVVPRVALPGGHPVHLHTIAVRGLHQLTVDTPRVGQLDSYQVLKLHGTASLVDF